MCQATCSPCKEYILLLPNPTGGGAELSEPVADVPLPNLGLLRMVCGCKETKSTKGRQKLVSPPYIQSGTQRTYGRGNIMTGQKGPRN